MYIFFSLFCLVCLLFSFLHNTFFFHQLMSECLTIIAGHTLKCHTLHFLENANNNTQLYNYFMHHELVKYMRQNRLFNAAKYYLTLSLTYLIFFENPTLMSKPE